MKTTHQIRLENAKFLIDTEEDGNTAAFARKIGTDAAYLYQIFSEKTKKNYGQSLANKTTNAYSKPEG